MTKEVITTQNTPKVYILIDGSYYCFYRYFALNNWWKNAKADTELGDDPYENTEFRDKYKKVFVDKIQEMATKLKIKKTYGKKVEPIIIVGKDCPRKDIWRMELDNRYKINRIYDSNFKGGNLLKIANDNSSYNNKTFIFDLVSFSTGNTFFQVIYCERTLTLLFIIYIHCLLEHEQTRSKSSAYKAILIALIGIFTKDTAIILFATPPSLALIQSALQRPRKNVQEWINQNKLSITLISLVPVFLISFIFL